MMTEKAAMTERPRLVNTQTVMWLIRWFMYCALWTFLREDDEKNERLR